MGVVVYIIFLKVKLDLSAGKIYKLVSQNVGEKYIYVGSTSQKRLRTRMIEHRSKYKNWNAKKNKQFSSSFKLFDKYGIKNCSIELIEDFPCSTRAELHAREGFYIRALKEHCLNSNIAGQTQDEYMASHRPQIRRSYNNWYANNREKKKAAVKAYRDKKKNLRN